jgi:hypothetical protein
VSAVDQHAEAHRLKNKHGYGARRIAEQLGITRHAATLLLSQPLAEPVAEVAAGSGQPPAVAAATDGQERRPVAARALPRRAAGPLDGFDVSQWPALRRDLAVLAQTGRSAEALAHQAVTAMAHHYRRALDHGDIAAGQPFIVTQMTLRPIPVAGRAARAG